MSASGDMAAGPAAAPGSDRAAALPLPASPAGRSGPGLVDRLVVVGHSPAARRVLGALVVALVVAGVSAAVARRGGDAITGAGRVDTDGKVLLTRADGTSVELAGSANLHDGDVVEARVGTMTVRLTDGATLEGHPAGDGSDASKVRAGSAPELLGGELLVTAPDRTTVDAAGNHVTVVAASGSPAAARVSRSLAVRVGSYRGEAAIDSAGQERAVPALREMDVAVLGRPPAAPKPLALDHPDGWDRRFLGEAIDLGLTLQSLSNAYSPTLRADEGRTAAFYRNLLPSLASVSGFDDQLVRSSSTRPQGELLVGAAIAGLGTRGAFGDRWRALFAFRDEGATWGLVALEQGVAAGPLLAAVNAAVDRTTFQFAAATPTPPTAPPATAASPPAGNQPSTPTTAAPATSAPPAGNQPPPTTTPTTAPDPGALLPPVTLPPINPPPPGGGNVVGGLVDAVGQLLGGLLGGK